jgi:hypothetical protein
VRYRLRTLLILMAVGPPALAGAWAIGPLLLAGAWWYASDFDIYEQASAAAAIIFELGPVSLAVIVVAYVAAQLAAAATGK